MQSLLLKLSGEALAGEAGFGIDPNVLQGLSADISQLHSSGVKVGVVLGGGNIFRGQALQAHGLDRVAGDRLGMLATIMNGIALGDFLNQIDVPNQVFSASEISGVVPGYNRDSAKQAMHNGQVVILSGGTGNPYFTTDTAACLRGIELGVDAVIKATNTDGVYDSDPNTNPQAVKYDTITYDEVLQQQLGVMDLTAIVLCKENNMPLVVCDIASPGILLALVRGEEVGTRVTQT